MLIFCKLKYIYKTLCTNKGKQLDGKNMGDEPVAIISSEGNGGLISSNENGGNRNEEPSGGIIHVKKIVGKGKF